MNVTLSIECLLNIFGVVVSTPRSFIPEIPGPYIYPEFFTLLNTS